MYSLVLMMAMTSPADDVAFGKRGGNCHGGEAYSCSGSGYGSSCSGSGSSCHGSERGGFLGLRAKFAAKGASSCHGGGGYSASYSCSGGSSCHGGGERHGLFGKHKHGNSCHGGSSCCGASACCGQASACCSTQVVSTCGCCGTTMGAMAYPTAPYAAPVAPPVGPGVGAPPVKMPEPPAKKPE